MEIGTPKVGRQKWRKTPKYVYKKKDKSKSQEIVNYVVLPLPCRGRPYVRSIENLNFIFGFFLVKISDFFRQYLFGRVFCLKPPFFMLVCHLRLVTASGLLGVEWDPK